MLDFNTCNAARLRRDPAFDGRSFIAVRTILPSMEGHPYHGGTRYKLIAAGALDCSRVEALAERLGVGPRHLSRLFNKPINATPLQAARRAARQRAVQPNDIEC